MDEENVVDFPPTKKLKLENENSNQEIENTMDDNKNASETGDNNADRNMSEFAQSDELQKLREFKVLDEVKSNEGDSRDEDSDTSDDKSEGLPEEEIEKMLEEGLPQDLKGGRKPKEKPYITRKKIVLEEKGVNQFEVLPLDWMVARHHSGMPVYVHKATRVCTLSKPYFLGKGNIRKHDIPLSAIPCLAYRRALEEEEKQKEIDRKEEEQIRNLTQKVANSMNQSQESTKCDNIFNIQMIPGGKKNDLTIKSLVKKKNYFKFNSSKGFLNKCPINHVKKTELEQAMNTEHCKDTCADNVLPNSKNKLTNEGEPNENNTLVTDNEPKNEHSNTSIVENTIQSISSESELKDPMEANEQLRENVKEETMKTGEEEVINEKSDAKAKETDILSGFDSLPLNRRPVILPSGEIMPAPRVESINNSWKTQSLTAEQFNDYCKSLFKFKTVNIMQFNRWADRRKYVKAKKTMQYPTLPEGTKLITIPMQNSGNENGGKGAKRDWVMNMNDGSYLSVFHEYVCRALQKQPVYEYKQLENATTPYQATVFIGGMQYGVGHGSSKRQAKYAAARASIHILIPEMREYLDAPASDRSSEPDFTFFDYVGIEDPRIAEFCAATCEPSPHAILRTCLLRNFGASDRHIHTEMKKLENQEIELTMKVGKHSATVVCKNKKTAKQRASQAILQALHPHVRSWGSLLRLYGSKSVKSCKEKKMEEQQITLLQDKARHNEPNYAVLEKLRNEMRKLRERDEAVVPIGTLLVTEDLPTHSGSNLNNVDL